MSDKWLKKYDNIDLSRMNPKILSYLGSLPEDLQKQIKVTSANDGSHSKDSYHYKDRAIDLAYNEQLYNHIAKDPNRHMSQLTLIDPNHGTAPHIHLSLANPGGREFNSDVDKEGRGVVYTREGWDVKTLNFDSEQKGSPHEWITQGLSDLPPLLTDKDPENVQWLTNIKPFTQPAPHMEYEKWNRLGWMDGRIFNDDIATKSSDTKSEKDATKSVVDNLEDSPVKSALMSILDEDTPRRTRRSSSEGDSYSGGFSGGVQGASDLRTMISNRESSGSGGYKAESKNSSAVGKYQFLWDTHGQTIQKVTGVKDKKDFLNNPGAQEKYFDYYLENDLNKSFSRFSHDLKRDFPGISDDKIKSMIHFAGSGNIENAIRNKSYNQPLDANGVSITSYIGKMENGGNLRTPPFVKPVIEDLPLTPNVSALDTDDYSEGVFIYASDYPSKTNVDVSIANSPLHFKMSDWWSDRYKDGASENAFEFIDPTGMSSWNDVKRAINKHGLMSGETISSGFGAVPMAKFGKMTLGLVRDFLKQGGPKALTRALTTTTMYGAAKGSNVKDSTVDLVESIEEDNLKNGGWLSKYK